MMRAKIFQIMLCAAALAGCVSEGAQECSVLYFTYTGDGDTEILPEKVDRLDLYIFDAQHRVVVERPLTPTELLTQRATVPLPAGGTYRAIAVANAHTDQLRYLHEGTFADTRIYHPVVHPDIETGSALADSHDHLYLGSSVVAVPASGIAEGVVELKSSHVEVYVELRGFGHTENDPSSRAGGASRAEGDGSVGPVVELQHAELPAWTDFENRTSLNEAFEEQEVMTHHPGVQVDADNRVHEYNVMRDVLRSTIYLTDPTGKEVFALDLGQFLDEHPEIDYDAQEALVPIRIEYKTVGIEVSIPEWAIQDVTPEF
ncbi:MAG: FimB/Mfa2 family fimbrial subunit [Alistipes sp.]|jgi:hypothetical protein|nr:FimB/Mfa2 family fimbrial subunit [Alistipes sp.]